MQNGGKIKNIFCKKRFVLLIFHLSNECKLKYSSQYITRYYNSIKTIGWQDVPGLALLFKKTHHEISLGQYKSSIHKAYATGSLVNPFRNYEVYFNFYLVSQYQRRVQHIDAMKSIKQLSFARNNGIIPSTFFTKQQTKIELLQMSMKI